MALERAQAAFVPAVVEAATPPEPPYQSTPELASAIVLELNDGRRLQISASAQPALAAAALRAVR